MSRWPGPWRSSTPARERVPSQVNPAEASAYIVNPLRGRNVTALFSTHPPAEERIARLRSNVWV